METIKQLITDGKTDEAIRLLDLLMKRITYVAMPTVKKGISGRP